MKRCAVLLLVVVLLASCGEDDQAREPVVHITSPADGAKVFEVTEITAEASDDKGVTQVEFYIDAGLKATDVTEPYSYSWSTTSYEDSSSHTIFAKAYDTDDNATGSELVTVTVDNSLGVPTPVVLNPVAEITATTMLLTWSENTNDDFAMFKVFRSLVEGVTEGSEQLATIYQDTATSYLVGGLQDNKGYYFRVFIHDSFGYSSGSNEVTATTVNVAPRASTLQRCASPPVTETSIPVCWTRNTDHDFSTYRLYRLLTADVDTNSTLIFETQNVGVTTCTDTGLTSETEYYYRLYVYDTGQMCTGSNTVAVTTSSQEPTPPEMVLVPAGAFMMGDGVAWCGEDEHQVTLTRGFYLGKYEVTNKEYQEALQWAYDNSYVTATSSAVIDNLDGSTALLVALDSSECCISFSGGVFTVDSGKERYPMVHVSWYGAAAYCDWLSMSQGLARAYNHGTWECNSGNPYDADGYRLPTDAEWEYATQYGGERVFPWGDQSPDCSMANFKNIDYCVGTTTAIGSYPAAPAALGLYDMAGNVWEWCNDWHTCNLGTSSVVDPTGPVSGSFRVLHGGSWYNIEVYERCAYRNGIYSPWRAFSNYGLRCARSY